MIRHENIPRSVCDFLAGLSALEAVDGLILFGSRAYGDHDVRSDVDIAVQGSTITRAQWARIRDDAYYAKSLYWISLVHFDSNPPALKQRIIATGVLIYVRPKIAR